MGQRVELRIDVLSADGWAQARSVRDFEVPGALVLRLETQGTRLSERIDSKDCSGQRYSLNLYPQRGGQITVPAIPLDVTVTTYGSGGGVKESRAHTEPFSFSVRVPPGAEEISDLVSTERLTVKQEWSPELINSSDMSFKVGDALKRSITREAADISAMAFAPVEFAEIGGAAVYPDDARVDDKFDRGDLTGKRVDSATYVFDRPGTATLPTLSMTWWNLKTRELETEEFPGVSLEIETTPEYEASLKAAAEASKETPTSRSWPVKSMALAIAIAVIALIRRRSMAARWSDWRAAREATESAHFARLNMAARANDAPRTYQSLIQWLSISTPMGDPPTPEQFLAEHGDDATREEYGALLEALTRNEPRNWSGARLAEALPRARRDLRLKNRLRQRSARILPPLNP